MIQNYINHIVFVVDKSGSMQSFSDQVVKVFDGQVEHLARRSKELNQETRASVYLFSDNVECLVYDIDVLRLPSLKNYYRAGGNTALIDGTLKSVRDLQQTPQLYGDHAFLVYVLTDGQENRSSHTSSTLSKEIKDLPENWTLAVLVPNQDGIFEAKKFGFFPENISIWDTSSKKGVEDVGKVIRETTDSFMRSRSLGIRGTKTLFKVDASKLTTTAIKNTLDELRANEYELLPVYQESQIKDYVESWLKTPYVKGSAYYMLNKPEVIQAYKQILIQNKLDGKVFSGINARKLLNLPDHEVKVSPGDHFKYDIFCQSTSTNRKLVKGTKLIVLK